MSDILRSINFSTRILLLVLALFVASIWGLALRVATVLQTELEQTVYAKLSTTVDYVAADIDAKLHLRIGLLKKISASITPDILGDPAKLQRLLEQRQAPSELFPNGIVVANTDGAYIAEYPHVAGRLGGSVSDRDFIREIMAGATQAVGSPVMGRFAKRVLVGLAVPVHDASGGVAGVLAAAIFPSDPYLFGLLEQTRIGKEGYFFVISPKDRVIVAATDNSRILKPMPGPGANPLFDRRLHGFEGVGRTINTSGVDVLTASRNIRTSGWMVIAGTPTAEAFAPITSIKRQIFFTALALSLLIMMVLYFVLRRQLAPLQQASTAMRRMSEGSAGFAPLPGEGKDEIGLLLTQFNRLTLERNRLEQSLRRNSILLDCLPIAVRHADSAQRISYANHAYRALLGRDAPEPVGRTVRDVLDEERYAAMQPNIRRALDGEEVEVTREFVRDDGSTGTRLTRYLPDHNAAGEVVGFYALIEDISKRKQAEAALRDSEERLRLVIESLAEGVMVLDAQGRILSANQAAQRILGFGADQMLGRNSSELGLRAVGEDGSDVPDDLYPAAQTLRTGKPQTGVVMGVHKPDGALGWLSINSRLLPSVDAPRTRVAVISFADVTAQKAAAAHQRLAASVFDHAAEAIMISDPYNSIVSVNRAFSDITGYAQEEVIGKDPRVLNSGMHDAAFYREMWQSIQARGRWSGEIWDRRKNGEVFCEYLSISVVYGDNGAVANYCCMFSDITRRKNAEAALLRLNAELEQRVAERTRALEQANRELHSFSYSISHDLRAPLRAIDGFSKIVTEDNAGKFDPKTVDYLGKITAAAGRMGRLIDDLLDLSQVSRQELRRNAVDLSRLAEEVTENLAQAHAQRQVEVLIAPNMTLDADRGLVQVLLENLIGNAWKFTARARRAKIEIGRYAHDGEVVYFVRDNGAGFDMRNAGKLFVAFQRLHTQREFEGSGIGLSIVQRIVNKHGGRIWADAKPGVGATLYFTLAPGRGRTEPRIAQS